MAFLNSTPQEDLAAIGAEVEAKSKQAILWFVVIAIIVIVIVYGSKK